jgi:arsenite-transporting ATPase
MEFLQTPSRHLFFTGKGGVGKTSVACATALTLAAGGRRVLLVSTDPASNLDEVLATPLTQTPTAIPGAPGLSALNLDPEAAALAYRERVVGPYRGVLPRRPSAASRSSSRAPARWRSRPSTPSRCCSATRRRPPTSTR